MTDQNGISMSETDQRDDYEDFVRAKVCETVARGFDPPLSLSDSLFPHQRAIVEWACRKGTAAVFAAFGLGKSRIQL